MMALDKIKSLMKHSFLEVILIIFCIFLAFSAPGFSSIENLLNVLRSASMQGVMAFGMTIVIIAGEIDLSVGSGIAFSACLIAYLTRFFGGHGMPLIGAVPLAIACCFIAGSGLGAITGYIRTKFQVPTFIITLAWLTALRGVAELITDGFPITPFPEWYNFIGGGYLCGIPVPAIVFLLAFAAIHSLMNYTSFGRSVYAVGGNSEAARLSGININAIKIIVMAIMGFMTVLSGVMQSSQIMSGTATMAVAMELDVISAVIIGGASFTGGSGTIKGTLIGILFLAVLVNGMTLLNINIYWQHVVRGLLILTAVLVNYIQSGKYKTQS